MIPLDAPSYGELVAEVDRQRQRANISEVELRKSRGLERMRFRENSELRIINAKMLAALMEAERYLEYLGGETAGTFVGPGMPADALAQTRAIIAEATGEQS
jgi:hypothetical protein